MKVGIYFRKRNEEIIKIVSDIISFFKTNHSDIFIVPEVSDIFPDIPNMDGESPFNIPEILVSLGGDGTFLRASHYAINNEVPIVGINLGNIGFLTNIEEEEILSSLTKLLNKEYEIEERNTIFSSMIRSGKEIYNTFAVNDFVIQRDPIEKIIEVEVFIDNMKVAMNRGDGIIISTPTGSTGYSMAAGGPIIDPTTNVMLITPLCPHKLSSRSIIIPDDKLLTLSITTKGSKTKLINDGVDEFLIRDMDRIKISTYDKKLKIITLTKKNYFDILNKKFYWGL